MPNCAQPISEEHHGDVYSWLLPPHTPHLSLVNGPLLAEISVPTLVIHGTEDPILPYPHGVALAETIPGAELLTLEKAGHEIPRCFEDEIVEGMLALQNL